MLSPFLSLEKLKLHIQVVEHQVVNQLLDMDNNESFFLLCCLLLSQNFILSSSTGCLSFGENGIEIHLHLVQKILFEMSGIIR